MGPRSGRAGLARDRTERPAMTCRSPRPDRRGRRWSWRSSSSSAPPLVRWVSRRPSRAVARPSLPGSSRKRPPPACITSTTATSRSSWEGASPRSTATTTAGPTSTSPAAPTPRRSIATRARSAESCDSSRCRTGHRPHQRRRRLPVDIDGDGHIDLAVLRYGENVLLRGLGDCRFERANEAWGYDGGDAWTTAFSAKWEGSATLPTLAFGNYLDMSHGQQNATLRRQRAGAAEGGRATYGRRYRSRPAGAPCRSCSATGTGPGARDLRMTNDRHYYLDGEEQLWRVAAGEPPRLYTHDEGWQQMRIWGMGIASYDLTGDGYAGGVPDEPGRQQAPDARRRSRPTALPRHRARSAA